MSVKHKQFITFVTIVFVFAALALAFLLAQAGEDTAGLVAMSALLLPALVSLIRRK